MSASRAYRLIESALIALFFWQALRAVFALTLSMTSYAISSGQANLLTVNAHLMLIAALALSWFAPRARSALPRTLMVSAILAAVLRAFAAIDILIVRLVTAVAVIGFCGVYLAALIRANWRVWVTSIVLGLVLDQLFRSADTYDPSLKGAISLAFGDTTYRVAWLFFQVALSLTAAGFAWLARRQARNEPYEPAGLSIWGGFGIAGFFAVEMLTLAMPNVVARWTGVQYVSVVPWVILFTALPLVPSVRLGVGQVLDLFDNRLRGWVWLFLFLLAIVVGNRLGGMFGAGTLIAAQFMAVLSLWWLPSPLESGDLEQVGPSFSLGLFVFAVLVYAYSLTFENIAGLRRFQDQGLIVVLTAAALLGVVRLLWRDDDPWLLQPTVPRGLPVTFVVSSTVFCVLLATGGSQPVVVATETTLSVATYNLNQGFDENHSYQLELAARTIEASLADVVILQQVDTGRPVGMGIDQVEFLARRLKMYQAYQSGDGKLLGVAILSKWSIIDRKQAVLSGAGQSNSALRVVLKDPATGRAISVIAAQLVSGSEQARLSQLYSLQTLAGDNSPTLIGIDLGVSPDDMAYQQIMAGGYLDPDVALGIEQGFTTPASTPTARHDYVFVRGLIPLASRHVNSAASTHRLVVIEVGWPQ